MIIEKEYKYELEQFGKGLDGKPNLESGLNRFYDLRNEILGRIVSYCTSVKIEKYVHVNADLLDETVLSYISDIVRYKEGNGIQWADPINRASFLSNWIVRVKPIEWNELPKNLDGGDRTTIKQNLFINEYFSLALAIFYINKLPGVATTIQRMSSSNALEEFTLNWIYYFKYRDYSARSIRMALVSFAEAAGANVS
ncbi:MAG: hypothetical protein LBN40_05945 [Oscillospiraceae bacterium]|nr:hypothetical protein [Oscillospiraceae bacterium]